MSKRWAASLVAIAAGACGNFAPPPQAMPWLFGFATTATADGPTEAAERAAAEIASSNDAAYGAVEMRAELTGGGTPETVLAAYGLGIIVRDAEGHTVARAPAFAPEGSADSIVSLAAGLAGLDTPVLAVAYQHGGHRENQVTLALYRVGDRGVLEPLFSAPIEEHEGSDTRAGSLVLVSSQLSYRGPDGVVTRWRFDPARGRYLELPSSKPRVLD